jgi:hypothetical protein
MELMRCCNAMLSNRVLWCLVTLFRVLRGKLRATANEIMRGRSERVTTEAIWTRAISSQLQASVLE